MNVIAIYGSPRKHGNTSSLLRRAVRGARDADARVEEVVLCDLRISPCLEIYGCKKTGRCVIEDDFQPIYDQLAACDGIMLASPVFFYAVSAHTKALMDRCQSFWVKKYWIERVPFRGRAPTKKGVFISAGATEGKKLFDGILASVRYFFDALDAELWRTLTVRGVDYEGDILKYPELMEEAYRCGHELGLSLGRDR